MKKILLTALSVVLVAALAIGGTLAYLTDRDAKTNVFTVGNVDIALNDDFAQGIQIMPGTSVEGNVSVTNTGKNEAWVWVKVTVSEGLEQVVQLKDMGAGWNVSDNVYKLSAPLAVGETTADVFAAIEFAKNVDIAPNGDLYFVDGGVTTKINWNVNTADRPVVEVAAYAIQKDNFANVEDAYDAYKDQWGTNDNATADVTVVEAATKADIKSAVNAAVASGAKEIVVDAEGANIGNLNYGISTAMVPEGTTLTIANAKIEGKNYGNAVNGTVVFTNCTFTNTGAYSIHFDAGKGNVVFNNCTLEGWCSFGAAISSVELNNCTIKGNGTYAMYRFYQNTTFNNCVFDCENANHADAYPDGVSAVYGAVVELNGCELNYCDLELENGKIIVDGVVVAESVNDEYIVIKNADWNN